jgi:signal transduction histidine kinase
MIGSAYWTLVLPDSFAGPLAGTAELRVGSLLHRAARWSGAGSPRRRGTAERASSGELLEQLPLIGEVFANALSRKQGELKAQRLRQDLAHIGRVSAMGELTASLAHELSQPLREAPIGPKSNTQAG